MFKIKIVSPGKTKEAWLNSALQEYEKRLRPTAKLEWVLQPNPKLENFIALDPQGEALTSEAFAKWLEAELLENHSRLTFAIGGPEGFSAEEKRRAKRCISLSTLTFTHQITRLILLEQLYRAFEILKGSKYHR